MSSNIERRPSGSDATLEEALDNDQLLLHRLAEDYNNIVYDELEDYLLQFQTLCKADPALRGGEGALPPTPAEHLCLPMSKLPALIQACQLTHLDAHTFTPEGFTEALYREHRKYRDKRRDSPEAHATSSRPVSITPPSNRIGSSSFRLSQGEDAANEENGDDAGSRASSLWKRVSARLPGAPEVGRHRPTKEELAPFKKDEGSELSFEEFAAVLHIAKIEEFEPRKPPIFPFDPESTPKQIWDLIVMVFLLYTTFSVPYLLSFGERPVEVDGVQVQAEWTAYDTFDLMLDCLFCTDVIINFCTAVVLRGVYVTDLHQIWLNYIKTWFVTEVIMGNFRE